MLPAPKIKKYRVKINTPFVGKDKIIVWRKEALRTPFWAVELGRHFVELFEATDAQCPSRYPEFFEPIENMSHEDKWRRILTHRLRCLGCAFDPQNVKDIAGMLAHYEYDPDFIWDKHEDELEKLS